MRRARATRMSPCCGGVVSLRAWAAFGGTQPTGKRGHRTHGTQQTGGIPTVWKSGDRARSSNDGPPDRGRQAALDGRRSLMVWDAGPVDLALGGATVPEGRSVPRLELFDRRGRRFLARLRWEEHAERCTSALAVLDPGAPAVQFGESRHQREPDAHPG